MQNSQANSLTALNKIYLESGQGKILLSRNFVVIALLLVLAPHEGSKISEDKNPD